MSFKAGFVGMIGLPNSGKSTLLNALVGEKVSIVTAKPQTTRRRVMGIVTTDEFQAVFVDAPGVVHSGSGLNQFLRDEIADVTASSDALIAVLNIDENNPEKLKEIIALAEASKKPWLAFINKTDLPLEHRPQMLRRDLEDKGVPVLSGSSLKDEPAVREMIFGKIAELLPESRAPLFDKELLTPSTVRELAAEIIREKSFIELHQEIPFGLAVRIIAFKEDEGPAAKIYAEILVAKPNHLAIVVGKKAQVLKRIGVAAREEIEKMMDRKVYLDLKVSASKGWYKNPMVMKELGYVVNP